MTTNNSLNNTVATVSTTTNASFFPLMAASSTNGNQAINLGAGLTFNPSTNNLTTTTFTGALTGNSSTTTAALGLKSASTTIDVSAATAPSSGQVLTATDSTHATWQTVTGTGTVTTVSVVTANGVSGSVANATTTPAITLTLGAITPSSVAATGTITGTKLFGTIDDAVTNAVTYTERLTHTSSGTVAAGFGTGTEYVLENASGTNRTVATQEVTYTTATNTAEDGKYTLKIIGDGTLTDVLEIVSGGGVAAFSAPVGFYLDVPTKDAIITVTSGTAQLSTSLGDATLSTDDGNATLSADGVSGDANVVSNAHNVNILASSGAVNITGTDIVLDGNVTSNNSSIITDSILSVIGPVAFNYGSTSAVQIGTTPNNGKKFMPIFVTFDIEAASSPTGVSSATLGVGVTGASYNETLFTFLDATFNAAGLFYNKFLPASATAQAYYAANTAVFAKMGTAISGGTMSGKISILGLEY